MRWLLNGYAYDCLGWEEVDGVSCLKVKFANGPRTNGRPGEEMLYWLDMNRGGNPLRLDYSNQGRLWARTDGIKLAQISSRDDEAFWFPVAGVFSSFLTGDFSKDGRMETWDRPCVEQKFVVLDGTLRFNQDFPDERFKATWKADREDIALKSVRSEFEKEQSQVRKTASRRRIDETLKDADEQKILLEASAPSREKVSNTTVVMLLSGSLGIVLIASYLLLKRAGR